LRFLSVLENDDAAWFAAAADAILAFEQFPDGSLLGEPGA
jgi:hypothetical protein